MRGITISHHPSPFLLFPEKSTPRRRTFHTYRFLKFYYTYSQFYSICSAPFFSFLIYPTLPHCSGSQEQKSCSPYLTMKLHYLQAKDTVPSLKKTNPNQPQNKAPLNRLFHIQIWKELHPLKRNTLEKPQEFLIILRFV